MIKSPRKGKRRKILTILEKKQRKQKKDITTTFKSLGFQYLNTEGKEKTFDSVKGEIDVVFIYENIIIICEMSLDSDLKQHVLKKGKFFSAINNDKKQLIDWLKKDYTEKFDLFGKYPDSRYKIKFLYIHEKTAAEETKKYYDSEYLKINFLDEKNLKYFKKLSGAIKFSGRYELFKFLNLNIEDINVSTSEKEKKEIDSAVILPQMNSGFPAGIRIVSFLMSAEQLLKCAYVSRNDNWENKLELYQRLIEPARINQIRKFIAEEQKSFINNIVVSLPDSVMFSQKVSNTNEKNVNIFEIDTIQNLTIKIPIVFNSIGIIDGQHRLYAHYEADKKEKFEKSISELRGRMYLLVTGLIFSKSIRLADRVNFESKLFLEINDNQKSVPALNLLKITSLKEPYSPIGISLKVLNALNTKNLFLNYFDLSSLSSSKIKIPSLTKWGLKDLLEISMEKETLFKYWNNDNKLKLLDETSKESDVLFEEYIQFCVNSIVQYFSGIKIAFKDDWECEDEDNRFFSVTAFTGFVIAFRMSLAKYEIKEPHFYAEKLKQLQIGFKKKEFPYKSSHWNAFAQQIDEKCWK